MSDDDIEGRFELEIWKYPLTVTDVQHVLMPEGANILSVQEQDGRLCAWAIVCPDARKMARRFLIFGTGHPIDDYPGVYVGTVQVKSGCVWHVFERGEFHPSLAESSK